MFLNLNNLRINYEASGTGPPVFLLHGWGANLTLFRGLMQNLSTKYRVIALDFPGFGQSEEPPEPWGVGDYANLTLQFIKHFTDEPVILLGHSFGCRVIIKIASQDPCPVSISKIILTGAAGIKPPPDPKKQAKVKAYKTGKKILGFAPVKAVFPNALDNLKNRLGSPDYKNASEVMRGSLVKTLSEDLIGLLPQVKPETLLIWGKNDTETPLSAGEKMETLIPKAGLAKIENAGHYAFLDQPTLFTRILNAFI
jgi:pimeloyl-ACP methyl ester carboxylesterase